MKITQGSIKRAVTTSMIYLIAIGFGLFSLARLKLDLYPKLEFPMIAVITQYTGVGPEDMETVVTRPIEKALASVKNVKKLTSTSAQGVSLVMLEFDWGTDLDQSKIEMREALDIIRSTFPQDMTDPLLFAFDISAQPIIYLTVESDVYGQAELRRISENDVEPRLERIAGVASAFTYGGMRREIKVLADPGRMRARNVTLDQLVLALRMNNIQSPSGWIENEYQEFTLQTSGEYASLEEIENTTVAVRGSTLIRIKDVARVIDGFAEQRQKVWANGKPSVMLAVQKQSDANTVEVCREVVDRMSTIESELPRGVKLGIFYDTSMFITSSMSNLGSTALQAVGLTFLVLLFFLRNMRSSLIVAVSIPVSIIVTFAVMDTAGLTLNIVSMAGLALAVGMLVDNSIVVLESIFRHSEGGEAPPEASDVGTSEVAMAITASTLTTLAVFVPVLFVPGLAGELFNEMVVTICFSLTLSLIVALTLVPLLASRFLGRHRIRRLPFVLERMAQVVGKWLDDLHRVYAVALHWCIHHRKKVLLYAIGAFVLSVVILANLGGDFMPQSDMGFMSMTLDRSPGTSLTSMEKSAKELNDLVAKAVPEAEMIYINFGQGEGIMAMFSSQSSSEGDMTIRLKKLADRDRSMFDIQDDLRERVKPLTDLTVRFEDRGAEAMFGTGGDIVVQIFGHDFTVAEALSTRLAESLKKVDGIADVVASIKATRPELKITPDRRRIADLGLTTTQVGNTISTSILGTVATVFREGGDEYNIRVQLAEEARVSKEDLENILIMTPAGKQVPLGSLATIIYSTAPREINREDQERVATLALDVSGRDLSGATKDVESVLRAVSVPVDSRLEISGAAKEQQESFMYLGLAALAAILLVYMVMASQFESLVDPFIIIFTVPLSIIGVMLGLVLTGTNLNVMSLIGIVMLVGIIVNNGIVLVDYMNQLRHRGMELFAAVEKAGSVRLRPVLMTALTTILGLLPLALGIGESGESWAPMARSVMGGMTVGTVLTLLVVPVIYIVTEQSGKKVNAFMARKFGRTSA
ncbi:MAG: hydrophobic/amphiphilic exporter-1, family [Bacteroidetes bacterium]|nr:hydrophobic/amphiphilic exporter-1, family [Bacteroidota bacterium]